MTATQAGVVIMGVSGAGKSTVGVLLGQRLGIPFLDGDALHPLENVEKMSRGVPLVDEDRWDWLDRVGDALDGGAGAIVACSALRRAYRDRIRNRAGDVIFIHLDGSPDVLAGRMRLRADHFMPLSLLESQLATLEPLAPFERGVRLDLAADVADIVDQAAAYLSVTNLGARR